MKSVANPKFWQHFETLPPQVQELARKNFQLWRDNPQHPSLHFKSVGAYWSVRVGLNYRALAAKHGDTYIWFWIGHHSVYDRLIS